MSARLHISAVILAAGASSRMGRDKALLPWPPASAQGTLLSAIIASLRAFAEEVLVVVGHNAANLQPIAAASGASLVLNPAPERGQFSSLQCGVRAALDHGCGAAMITPVDCPPLSPASLQHLRAAFEQARPGGIWAMAPERDGRRGHPLFAARPLLEAYLAAPVSSNAREVKHAHLEKFDSLAVPDPLLALDLNTPEQYAGIAE